MKLLTARFRNQKTLHTTPTGWHAVIGTGMGDATATGAHALITQERQFSAHNYTPLPVVFDRASGSRVYDVEGHEYWDFGGAYCAINQGHNHPKIVEALVNQASRLSLSSRAFTHSLFGPWCELMTRTFGYEKVLPMNGGAEIVEASIKLARAWGYMVKRIPENEAVVLTFARNYHGRTTLATSMSTTENARLGYGPYTPLVSPYWDPTDGSKVLRYNNIGDLVEALHTIGSRVCAVLVESIQGEAGVILPVPGYLKSLKLVCEKHKVLYIADEIQVGLGRAGHLVYAESQGCRPDILLLAKSISGGLYPTSLLLTSADLMSCIRPNSHGATFSGSPLSCAVSTAALEVILEEDLCTRARTLGTQFGTDLKALAALFPAILDIRGTGLLWAIDLDERHLGPWQSWHLSMLLLSKGIIAKLVSSTTLKLTPPLNVPEEGLRDCIRALRECLKDLPHLKQVPGAEDYKFLSGSSTLS